MLLALRACPAPASAKNGQHHSHSRASWEGTRVQARQSPSPARSRKTHANSAQLLGTDAALLTHFLCDAPGYYPKPPSPMKGCSDYSPRPVCCTAPYSAQYPSACSAQQAGCTRYLEGYCQAGTGPSGSSAISTWGKCLPQYATILCAA
jgi:hypothetical protein